VLSVLFVNGIYFVIFAALFFLFKGFALQKGIKNPGFFFTTQMGVMILIRLFGGQIFDRFSKVTLVAIALMLTAAGFALLLLLSNAAWIFPIAVVFGLGMGLCVPPLNSLMFLVTRPEYRGYNANMMMLSVHCGNFLGPFVGAWIIDASGYGRFLCLAILISMGSAIFFVVANPAKDIIDDMNQ
jgi:MFS family permease